MTKILESTASIDVICMHVASNPELDISLLFHRQHSFVRSLIGIVEVSLTTKFRISFGLITPYSTIPIAMSLADAFWQRRRALRKRAEEGVIRTNFWIVSKGTLLLANGILNLHVEKPPNSFFQPHAGSRQHLYDLFGPTSSRTRLQHAEEL
jgi:hypothetical protein